MSRRVIHRRPILWMCIATSLIGHGVLFTPRYQVRYNASSSVPRGWYLLVPADKFHVGSLVFARLPSRAAKLAAERRYLPSTVPVLKHVAAMTGQFVCAHDRLVLIDGAIVARTLPRDGAGRRLDPWGGCRKLADDELFLFSDATPASYDSRYFGPVNAAAVLGEAIPLWTW